MNDRVVVRMFAGARDRVCADSIEIEIHVPASVHELKQAIVSQFESLRSLVEYGRIAIDNEFLLDTDFIPSTHASSIIALIPPVSGG